MCMEIPQDITFDCKRCGGCCGPHYVSMDERFSINKYLAEKGISKREYKNLFDKCPYFEDGSCLIYPVRPTACKLMGIAENMPCLQGSKPNRYVPVEHAIGIMVSSMNEQAGAEV